MVTARLLRLHIGQADDSDRVLRAPIVAQPAFGRNLRIALAMKGGVSLAVWIGGAVAELDILRRIRIVKVGDEIRRYLITDPADPAGSAIRARAKVYADALQARR